MTSTTRNILIGLALGVATGLFLGEKAGGFQLVAEAYLRLLQMTVLPYVMVSLIEGIGSLDGARARRLFVRVGTLSLVLWALALGAVMLMPLAFPAIESASFFSTTLVEARPPLDFVALYIPSNPFHSLANNIVPAVVLFSIFVGVALIGIERKQGLLENLMLIERGLKRANQFAVSLTPIGLFAIAAQMVGTVDAAQFDRVRVYLIAYAAMALLLSLWVLPGLVACLTPIPVHQILNKTRDALITAFTTGELFIVLPILIDRSKELLITHGLPEPEEGSPPEVIVPAFYNFPHAAKLLSLSFVLFAAWYSQTLLNLTDYPVLVLAGIVSLFGSINVALPFLLDLVKIPADTFQLFLTTGVINARFGTLTSAMYMITLALAGSYALVGNLRFSPARILRYALVTTGLTVATLAATGGLLRVLGAGTYDKDRLVEEMKLLRPPAVRATVLRALPSESASREAASVLEAMRKRGRIRVGYVDNAMPYSYFNRPGELVGFDVEMAYTLAGELGLEIEFLPVPRERLAEVINSGLCDIIMAGISVTTGRASEMVFSPPYIDETLSFVVPDHRRADFSSAEWVRATPGLRVAVPNLPYLEEIIHREFPRAEIVPISVDRVVDFLTGRMERIDALVFPAERGSYFTLLYPAFSVAVPHPLTIRFPLAYPVARRDLEFARFLGI
ncbi:MAG TPA: cation:dicarboxylase symporter family transporter, partial [Candidatus Binatia bacterium]|nr:cation:dicarboxylase symporter family transporter [Candidatus Binatia bacterium]